MIAREQFVDAVIAACEEIFELMLPLQLSPAMRQRPLPFAAEPADCDILATLGLTGHCSGNISLYLSEPLAIKLAGWLMHEDYHKLSAEVFESIGELINLIAGGLKNRLSSEEQDLFDLSIPLVISGKDKQVFHGTDKECIPVPVDTDQGLFYVILVLDRST